jgi:hypothetical protein
MGAKVATHIMSVHAHVAHALSAGQSGFFVHAMAPLELLLEDEEDEDDEPPPPPAPATPLDELELLLLPSPALPPVALPGSN